MAATDQGDSGYRVIMSHVIGQRLRQLQRQADQQGRGARAIRAFEQIVQRLKSDPLEFGEAIYSLPAIKLGVRHASIEPLVVHFGVHETEPLVFIKGIDLLPN